MDLTSQPSAALRRPLPNQQLFEPSSSDEKNLPSSTNNDQTVASPQMDGPKNKLGSQEPSLVSEECSSPPRDLEILDEPV